MEVKKIFQKARFKLMPKTMFKEIGDMAKVQFADDRVFVGLRIPYGGLSKRAASDPKRIAQFNDMLLKLESMGFQDIELNDKLDDGFPVDSVFIPIDKKHSDNKNLMKKMAGYTDYIHHKNIFPSDWELGR